jgi:hypothetical protein
MRKGAKKHKDLGDAVANMWSMRNDIENFQYGVEHKLHRQEGWLWQRMTCATRDRFRYC